MAASSLLQPFLYPISHILVEGKPAWRGAENVL